MIIMAYRQYRRRRIIADQRLGGLLAPHRAFHRIV
jgi:hypothetical protein